MLWCTLLFHVVNHISSLTMYVCAKILWRKENTIYIPMGTWKDFYQSGMDWHNLYIKNCQDFSLLKSMQNHTSTTLKRGKIFSLHGKSNVHRTNYSKLKYSDIGSKLLNYGNFIGCRSGTSKAAKQDLCDRSGQICKNNCRCQCWF